MPGTIRTFAVISTLLTVAACEQRGPLVSPAAPTTVTVESSTTPGVRSGITGGTSLKETLSGPAIAGVVPEGQAMADESQFVTGGSTKLTVQIKNVNLPDGTVLGVTLDYSPVGTITLSRGEGLLSADLGHFGVSRDQVRINHGATTILIGGFFN